MDIKNETETGNYGSVTDLLPFRQILVLIGVIGGISTCTFYFTIQSEESPKLFTALGLALSILIAILPFAITLDKLYKTKEILRKIVKIKIAPSNGELSTLILGFIFVALSYYKIAAMDDFLSSITFMAVGCLFIINSLKLFLGKNYENMKGMLRYINPWFFKSFMTIIVFSATAMAYSNLNDIFPVDPINFPLTLSFVFGFSIFLLSIVCIQVICIPLFLMLPTEETEGASATTRKKIKMYWFILYLGTFFFWGSFCGNLVFNENYKYDNLLRNAAYNLDFNSNFKCKEIKGENMKAIFLGPSHDKILLAHENSSTVPQLISCKQESSN